MNNIYDFIPIKKSTREKFIFSIMPSALMQILEKYLRLEVTGLEHINEAGPALIIPNHSGYSGLDAMILSHGIIKNKKRVPRVLTHHLWFASPLTGQPANKLGFIEATKQNGLQELKDKHLVILFPEGERGNFKPTKYAYKLQEFRRGFVRMAIETGSPIIPTMIIGAEETHINLKKIKLPKLLKQVSFPLPLNLFPLPVRWKIKFLPPIKLPHSPEEASNNQLVHKISKQIEESLQKEINAEIAARPGIFVHRPDWLQGIFNKLNIKI